MIKEITVFTNGESSEISTWSNVPFFFTETLMKKGIKVNRVNIYPKYKSEFYFNNYLVKILNRLYKRQNTYNYFRSLLHFYRTRKLIKRSIKKYPDSDVFMFLTFSFSAAGLTQKKIVQFGDWTYDYYFRYFLNREPNWFEKKSIQRENSQVEGSNLSLALFPAIAEDLNTKFNTPVKYLGNVINALYEPNEEEILELKKKSKSILFVGSLKYIEGARALVEAFKIIQTKIPESSLHFVGFKTEDFQTLPENVYCHGYLNKSIEEQKQLYYELVKNAKVFVNTTPKWGSFSSSLEVMYFYTPIIITPYKEFTETFGKEFKGGYFCNDNAELANTIIKLIESENYLVTCMNAHNLVQNFTWDRYIDKFLSEIENIKK